MSNDSNEQVTETTVTETVKEPAQPNTFGDVTAAVTEAPVEKTKETVVTERPVSESPEAQESEES